MGGTKTNRNLVALFVESEDAAAHGAFRSLFVFELSRFRVSSEEQNMIIGNAKILPKPEEEKTKKLGKS